MRVDIQNGMNKKRKRHLKNLNVEFISYVDRAANLEQYYTAKSLDDNTVFITKLAEDEYKNHKKEPNFRMDVEVFCSANEEERLVLGMVYAPNKLDAHNDWTDEESLRKAAENYLENYNKMDEQHNLKDGAGKIVQSYIAPQEMEVEGKKVTKGTWIIISRANEEVWKKIKKGIYTGYSLYGTAEVEYEKSFSDEFLEVWKAIREAFPIKKTKSISTDKENQMDEELKKALADAQELIKKLTPMANMAERLEKGLVTLDKIESIVTDITTIKSEIATVKESVTKAETSATTFNTEITAVKDSIASLVKTNGQDGNITKEEEEKLAKENKQAFPNRTI